MNDINRCPRGHDLERKARLAILCVVGGAFALTLQDALIKLLSETLPLHEITLLRSVIAIFITLLFLKFEGGLYLLKTKYPLLHLWRGLLLIIANSCFFFGVAGMPLAEATAVFFIAPLFITALSRPLLGERIGGRRWIAVGIGMFGMFLMLRPEHDTFDFVTLFPIGAALSYALLQILTRRLGATDRASSMALYTHVIFAFVSLLVGLIIGDGRFSGFNHPSIEFLLRSWSVPSRIELLILLICGVSIAFGIYLFFQAYRVAQPSLVAPLEYSALPLSLFWGFVLWGDWPDMVSMLGIFLILGSGILVFYNEGRVNRSTKSK